jgi:hypothetical protein
VDTKSPLFGTGGLEQRFGSRQPARIGQHGRRGANLIEAQPVGLFRKSSTEIDDLPFAAGIHKDTRHRRLAAFEQPELANINTVLGKLPAHLATGRILAAASPKRGDTADPGNCDRGGRRHAAAHGGEFQAPDLLASSAEKTRDAPDLIERG